jgi:hypothetical protein
MLYLMELTLTSKRCIVKFRNYFCLNMDRAKPTLREGMQSWWRRQRKHTIQRQQLVHYLDHVRQCANHGYRIDTSAKFSREVHDFILNLDTYFNWLFNMDDTNVDRTFGCYESPMLWKKMEWNEKYKELNKKMMKLKVRGFAYYVIRYSLRPKM